MLLSFESPLEFMLRYTVITGAVVAIIGCVLMMLAKRITQAKRNVDEIEKNDRLYVTLKIVGLCLLLIGMIIIALPIEDTFYVSNVEI